MNEPLSRLLSELEQFGATHDAAGAARAQRMLNITRDTGEFLAVLVYASKARRILEIGTSNGYATLWLADAAASLDGTVTTLEHSPAKVALAAANFARAGLGHAIRQIEGEAGAALGGFAEGEFDLIFLDSERSEYLGWWHDIQRVLRRGGLLVVDNATSHAGEMAVFVQQINRDKRFATALVPVGKGEFLATKIAS